MRRALAACAQALVAMLALCGSIDARAQVYAGTSDESGAVVLSNFPSSEAPLLLIRGADAAPTEAATTVAARGGTVAPRAKASAELNRLIDTIALQVKVPADLLHAVIAVESNYDLKALSPRGAMGLMQLLPSTAKRFGARDPYAAEDNVLAGASYLKWLMGLFDDNLELVLAAYNSGEQSVLKAGRKVPPFPETQAYVPRVLARLQGAATQQR
jgi:soluble lytic murein transglycosylase-like protein